MGCVAPRITAPFFPPLVFSVFASSLFPVSASPKCSEKTALKLACRAPRNSRTYAPVRYKLVLWPYLGIILTLITIAAAYVVVFPIYLCQWSSAQTVTFSRGLLRSGMFAAGGAMCPFGWISLLTFIVGIAKKRIVSSRGKL